MYDIPDECCDAFRSSHMKSSGINKETIAKPMLTMLYLEYLVNILRDIG